MSRHYRKVHDGWVRKQAKPYTLTWAVVRDARRRRRSGGMAPEQTRDKLGFIVKTDPATGGTVTVDPGEIDRYLWLQANPDDTT